MGAIVGAIAGALISEAVAVWVGGAAIIGSLTVGKIVGAVVGFAVSGLVTSALADDSGSQSASARERDRGALINTASTVEPLPRIVGFRRVGGAYFLKDLRENDSSKLLLGIAVGEGEIEAFDQVLLDGVPATDAKFNGLVTIEYHTGSDTQAASALLLAALPSKWTANHQGKGVAYAALELTQDPTAFANGLPTVTFDVRGAKMKDPRDAVTRFSPNPAIAIRDYLTNARFGRAIPESRIDDASFIAEANYFEGREAVPAHAATFTADAGTNELTFAADEIWDNGDGVTVAATGALPGGLAAATTYYVIRLSERRVKLATTYANALARTAIDLSSAGSGTLTMSHVDQPRYTANGVIDVELGPDENIRRLRSACRSWVFYSAGKYKLVCDKPTAPSGFVMNEDNIVGNWSIDLGGEEGRYNRVTARFFNPCKSWAPDLAISDNTAERADDGGAVLEGKLALDFTTNLYIAQRIAQIERRKSRLGIRAEHDLTIQGTKVECGDVIEHTHSTPGWTGKLFRVGKMGLKSNDEVTPYLMEYSADVWTLDGQSAMTIPTRTNLPDPSVVAPPTNLAFDAQEWELRGEGALSWTAAADAFVQEYHPEYKAAGDPNWTKLPAVPASSTSAKVSGITTGDYQFRVRTMNVMGAFSAYTSTLDAALTAPAMANVTGLALVGGAGATFGARDATFTWDRASADALRYWKDFKLQVCKPDNTVLRTEYVTDHVYTYSWENNAYDNGGTPLRAFKLKLWQRGQQGQISSVAATLDVSNPQCGAPAALNLRGEFNALYLDWTPPADIDAEGIIVHVSTADGFTPGAGNRRYKGTDRLAVIDNVLPGALYYVKAACYDAFGEDALTYSAQISVTTGQILNIDLAPLTVGMDKLTAELAQPISTITAADTANAIAILQAAIADYDLTTRMQWQEQVTNATITQDPVSGQIQLLATANVTTEVEARLSAVEVTLDADHASLTAAVATLTTVEGDLTSAQSSIEILQDQIVLTATEVYVDDAVANATGQITIQAANAYTALAEAEIRDALDWFAEAEATRGLQANVAIAQESLSAQASALSAEVTSRSLLVATVAANGAAIASEASARAAADSAEASAREVLAARVTTAEGTITTHTASIASEASARANGDSANASSITALDARMTTAEGDINTVEASVTTEQTARISGDNANASNITALNARVTTAEGDIDTNAAAITAEQSARASGDSANASSITAVSARLDSGDFASVKVLAEATADYVDGISARYLLQVDVNGKVAGMMLASGAGGSSVVWLADKLAFVKPDGTGTPKTVFVVGTVNSETAIGFDGNLLVDGSITANKVTVASLSALSAAIGTLTSGRIQNSGNTNFVNWDAAGANPFLKVGSTITINADGSASFNDVVLSRSLVAGSGSYITETPVYTTAYGEYTELAHWDIDTAEPLTAWAGANSTYIALAGMTGSVYAPGGTPPDVYWGIVCSVLPMTKWSGSQVVRLRLALWGKNVIQVDNLVINWKLYKVT